MLIPYTVRSVTGMSIQPMPEAIAKMISQVGCTQFATLTKALMPEPDGGIKDCVRVFTTPDTTLSIAISNDDWSLIEKSDFCEILYSYDSDTGEPTAKALLVKNYPFDPDDDDELVGIIFPTEYAEQMNFATIRRYAIMAKIELTEGFTLIPEGTHVFKITDVKYKEDFGKLEITMQTQGGSKHIERFGLLKSDGSPNEGAYNAFSYFAKTALRNFELNEIDHTDLIGHFIECDVEHDVRPNQNNPAKTVTFVRLVDKRQSDGWEDNASSTQKAASTPASTKSGVDLAALLG